MKVVYVKTVIEKIRDACDEAEKWGKKIEYIELTEPEWKEVSRYFDPPLVPGCFGPYFTYHILGVEIRKAH